MESQQPMPPEIVQLIQSFVDRIETTLLARQLPRGERMTICDEIESQIYTMIARRTEAGAELNLELVNSIIESMDPPESYARNTLDEPNVPQFESDPVASNATHNPEVPAGAIPAPSVSSRFKKFVPEFVSRHFGETPHTDPLGICGLIACLFGALLIPIGMGGRHGAEGVIVFGILLLFLGTIASAVSFWRIRSSHGKLLGTRYASLGLLVLPFVFTNCFLIAFAFATRLWMVLGALVLLAAFIYANYRVVRFALRWLETSSIGESNETANTTRPEGTVVGSVETVTVLNGASM